MAAYQGDLAITGGDLTLSGDLYVGGTSLAAVDPSAGTLTVSGGTLTVNGTSFVMGQNVDGANKVAQFTQTDGTVVFNGSSMGIGNGGGVSQLDFSGGTFTSTAAGMILGVRANSTVNISGTATVTLPSLTFGHAVSTAAVMNTVSLDGGRLVVGSIGKAGGNATLNFNGGTLQAAASTTTFLEGLDAANILAGGAIVDTAGYDVTIAQDLVGSGGLTKLGAGTLTLDGANSYKGGTNVNAGTLIARVDGATSANALGTVRRGHRRRLHPPDQRRDHVGGHHDRQHVHRRRSVEAELRRRRIGQEYLHGGRDGLCRHDRADQPGRLRRQVDRQRRQRRERDRRD